MIDANQVWEVGQAIDWVNELKPFNPYFIEEPTSPDDVEGHRKIREAVAPVKVATGEMCQNRILFKQFITRGAIDIVQIDACRIGGLNEVLAVLLMAAKYGLPVWPHAGGVGLCEYVQHLSMIDYIAVSRHQGGPGDRICRPPARAFRRSVRDPERGLHAADAAGLLDRDEAGVDRGERVPRLTVDSSACVISLLAQTEETMAIKTRPLRRSSTRAIPRPMCAQHVADGYRGDLHAGAADRAIATRSRRWSRRWPMPDVVIGEAGAWRNLIAHDEAQRKANVSTPSTQLAARRRDGRAWPASRSTAPSGTPAIRGSSATIMTTARTRKPRRGGLPARGGDGALRHRRGEAEAHEVLARDGAVAGDRHAGGLPEADQGGRPAAVRAHIDAANMIISPQLYFNTRQHDARGLCAARRRMSCRRHAKDIVMQGGPGRISFHMDEVPPGEGNLDYRAYLTRARHARPRRAADARAFRQAGV